MALDAFAEHSFSGTPTRTIAERAGVTPATVYHHFSSKGELYHAVYLYAIDLAYVRYEEAVDGLPSVRAELSAMLHCALAIMRERPAITVLAIRAETDLGDGGLAPVAVPASAQRFAQGMIDRAVARGELRAEDGALLDRLQNMLLWGLSMVGRDNERRREECVAAIERLADATLFAPPKRTARPAPAEVHADRSFGG